MDDREQVDMWLLACHEHEVRQDRHRKQEPCGVPGCGNTGTSYCCWRPHCQFYVCEPCVQEHGDLEANDKKNGRLWLMHFVKQIKDAVGSGKRTLYSQPIHDLPSLFQAMDRDDSGSVTQAEFVQALRRLDVPVEKEDVPLFLEIVDMDASGDIGLAELTAGIDAVSSLYEVGIRVDPEHSHRTRAAKKAHYSWKESGAVG